MSLANLQRRLTATEMINRTTPFIGAATPAHTEQIQTGWTALLEPRNPATYPPESTAGDNRLLLSKQRVNALIPSTQVITTEDLQHHRYARVAIRSEGARRSAELARCFAGIVAVMRPDEQVGIVDAPENQNALAMWVNDTGTPNSIIVVWSAPNE